MPVGRGGGVRKGQGKDEGKSKIDPMGDAYESDTRLVYFINGWLYTCVDSKDIRMSEHGCMNRFMDGECLYAVWRV